MRLFRPPIDVTPNRSWLMAAMALVMVTGGFVRSALPVLSIFVIREFDLSASEFGLLLTLFMMSLTVGAPVTGRITDVVGGRRLLTARFVVVVFGLAAAAAAPSYLMLAVVVIITALSLGGGNPGTNKLIAQYVTAGHRGTVMGVKQSGGQLGVLVAGLVLPAIAVAASWRVSLVTGIVIPIVGLMLLLTVVPPDRPGAGRAGGTSTVAPFDSMVLRQIGLVGFAMGAGVSAVFGFLPLYAQEEVGMSSTAAGAVVSLMAFVGVGARILWGRQSERADHFSEPFALLALLSIGATAAIAAASTVGSLVLWIGAAAAGASLEAWNSVGNLAVVTLVDLQHAGKASGLVMLGFLLGGALSPFAFGYLVDISGYGAAWTLVASCFAAALIVSLRWRHTEHNQLATPGRAA